jgi:hypothetical protein
MPSLTIILTDLQYAGLQKAQELHDLEQKDDAVQNPEAYAQKIMSRACDSFVSSLGVAEAPTIEALKREVEAKNLLLAEKDAEISRKDAALAEVASAEVLKAQAAEVVKI